MTDDTLRCKMILQPKLYLELSEVGKALYELSEEGYSVEFPALTGDGVTLGDCVCMFCETAYLEFNPKYAITEECKVKCEPYKLSKSCEVFNLLVTIQYPSGTKKFHELLICNQRKLSEQEFVFELQGDQTMFAFE